MELMTVWFVFQGMGQEVFSLLKSLTKKPSLSINHSQGFGSQAQNLFGKPTTSTIMSEKDNLMRLMHNARMPIY